MSNRIIFLVTFMAFCLGCGSKIKENTDKVYSRHLQKYIDLTIISTPEPSEKNDFNLLLLNEGGNLQKLKVKDITDSLYKKKLIKPLVIIGINTVDNNNLFGVTGEVDYLNTGKSAEKYTNFIINELLPFVKKKAGVRKFNTITLAGFSKGGLSAFDVAWDNWQKFDKVGVFSGNFSESNLNPADKMYKEEKNNLILNKINSSRKRPKLQYWFYAGGKVNNAGEPGTNVVDNTRKLIALINKKKVGQEGDIYFQDMQDNGNDLSAWASIFPSFLLWVAGK